MKRFQQILTLILTFGFLAIFSVLVSDYAGFRRITNRKTAVSKASCAVVLFCCKRKLYEQL